MSDKPAPKGKPGTAWNDPKVPGLRLVYTATKAAYYLSYRPRGGKQRKMKIGDESVFTLTKAREHARDILARVAKGEDPAAEFKAKADRPTMQMLRDSHMTMHVRVHNKNSWGDNVESYWDRLILPHFGADTAVADVTEKDVADLHYKLHETAVTANRVRSVLSLAFNLAEEWKWIPRHASPVTTKKYKEKKRKRLPDAAEAVRFLHALESMRQDRPHFVALIELLLYTGARLREIMHAKWEWVKPDGLHLPDSKTGDKVIALPALAREVLAATPRIAGNPHIIPGRRIGRPLVSVKEPWKDLLEAAKIENLTRHDLRRFFASAGLSLGNITLDQLGGLLGHADASTTKGYAYLMANAAQQQADATANAVRTILTGGGNVIPFKTGTHG